MADYTAEVLVVGAGIAGIATALELLDHGRDVLMLDRDEEDGFGGLAKESFGGLFFVGSREQRRNGIADSPALALADWHSFAEFGPEDRFPRNRTASIGSNVGPAVTRTRRPARSPR